MRTARFCFLITILFGFIDKGLSALAQQSTIQVATVPGADAPSKFENDLQIFWRNTPHPGDPPFHPADPEAKIRIFEGAEHEPVICSVASTIRSFDLNFSGVSIWDVSARRPGWIAVAAVYTRTTGSPVALLLYFDWSGSLLQQVALRHRSELQSIAVVSDRQVWALNDFDPENRSRFVFTVFDQNGTVIKEAVKTRRHWSTEESSHQGGQTSFGVVGNYAWTWLPKSQTLITFDSRRGRTETKHTGFPKLDQRTVFEARQAVLLPSGELLMDVAWTQLGKRSTGWFIWSSPLGGHEVHSPVPHCYLYAVEGNRVIYTTSFGEGSVWVPTFHSESIADLLSYASPHS